MVRYKNAVLSNVPVLGSEAPLREVSVHSKNVHLVLLKVALNERFARNRRRRGRVFVLLGRKEAVVKVYGKQEQDVSKLVKIQMRCQNVITYRART
jgi:hypothetical protein